MADDIIEVVKSRNDFYRDNYRKVVIALLLCIFIIVILTCSIIYIITNPPEPRYFATTNDGRIMPLVPLEQPNLSNAALLQWANTAAISAYTYNFIDYRQRLQEASEYFTPDGWRAFLDALKASNNLNAVTDKKLVVSAVAVKAPTVLEQGILMGRYTWKVQLEMLVSYQSPNQMVQQNLVVTMLIVRVPTLNSARGIGIAQFIVSGSGGL